MHSQPYICFQHNGKIEAYKRQQENESQMQNYCLTFRSIRLPNDVAVCKCAAQKIKLMTFQEKIILLTRQLEKLHKANLG